MNIVVGLGNPGEEYKDTRHNAGRMAVEYFVKNISKIVEKILKEREVPASKVGKILKGSNLSDFFESSRYSSTASEGQLTLIGSGKDTKSAKDFGKEEKVLALLPETFMNKSGKALSALVSGPKKAGKLIVVHDDLDLPIGKIKIVFNRGSGGHKGVESINRAIKTEGYTRIRIGVCPTTPSGKPKKPTGDKLLDFIVGEFKPAEMDDMKKVIKKVAEAIYVAVVDSKEKAMTEYNG